MPETMARWTALVQSNRPALTPQLAILNLLPARRKMGPWLMGLPIAYGVINRVF